MAKAKTTTKKTAAKSTEKKTPAKKTATKSTTPKSTASKVTVKKGAPATADDIATRAYEIWESEGHPDGRAEAHWAQAESELNG